MASDRYRYLHHLHLLWVMCAWLAVVPSGAKLSLAWLLGWKTSKADVVPCWSIQLVRFQALVIYAASGLAKLTPGWLDGTTLALIEKMHLVGGPLWRAALAIGSYRSLSIAILLTELALPALLVWRKTRLAGVGLGLALHAGFSLALVVSTFGLQMALFLMLFLPWHERWPELSDAVQATDGTKALS